MKTRLLILGLMLTTLFAQAQDMTLAENRENPAVKAKTTPNDANTKAEFVFINYGIDLNHEKVTDYPEHLLGNVIAKKFHAMRNIYVKRYATSIGYSNNTVEISKPIIYNTITKLDSYFKKAVRRQEMTQDAAAAQFAKCLDIAYIAYYEDDTTPLENALKQSNKPEDWINLFNQVIVK